ncbi:T9SS type A sorting domain-containing protein [Neolewinella persica]|uniref:T9SS type A sorting domain-containing protein n=1 Tax=Neolewinella persica TaxID=70998 RepID=UPI00035E3E97|nr:T9SS type A sorting domain-containing protein [Neolewinella persica]
MRILILLLLLLPNLIAAQCPAGSVSLNSQAEVDAFNQTYPGCHKIDVTLFVEEISAPIFNLDSLYRIDTITEGLIVRNIPALVDLNGLQSLRFVGRDIRLLGLPNVTNLDALSNVNHCGEDLSVADIGKITDLSSLSALSEIPGDLVIINNPELTSLGGLENIITVGGAMSVSGNVKLFDITALSNVSSTGGMLRIVGNPVLTNLSGLEGISSVGGEILLANNDLLTSLAGVRNVAAASFSVLTLVNNLSLTDCSYDNICEHLSGGGTHQISLTNGTSNAPGFQEGCQTAVQIIEGCEVAPQEECGAQLFGADAQFCQPVYSYENESGDPIHGVAFRISGAEFNHDDIFWSMEVERPSFSSNSILLTAPDLAELPTLLSDFVGLYFQNVVASPIELIVEYRDSTLEGVICADTSLLNCPVPNYCLEVAADTLVCSETDPGYRLQMNVVVPNDNYTDDVGRIKIAVPGLAPIMYDFMPALTAGESFGIDTLLTGIGLTAGDSLKILVTAHDGPEERLCCFADSLCLPIPECIDPCEELDAQVIFQPSESPDASECCFDVVVINNTASPDLFDSLSIDLFFPGGQFPSFSPVSNPIWSFSLLGSNPFSWQFSGNPPTNGGMPEVIASFCIDRTEEEVFFEYSTTFIDTDSGEECALATEVVSCDPLPVTCDSISVTLAVNETDSCCYYLVYENSLPEGTIDSVQINLFEGPSYALDNFILTNNFAFSLLRENGRSDITLGPFPIFNTPIAPGTDTLLQFCLDPAHPLDSTRIAINTFLNGDVMEPCRDTLAALCPAPDPCDSLAAYILPDEDEPCCYNVFLDNTYANEDDPLQSVTVNLVGGPAEEFFGFSRIPVAPGWAFASVEEERRRYTLTPSGANVPTGLGQQVFQFCVAEDFSTDSTYVEIAWQTATDTICADTVAAICQNCLAIEEEELGCNNGQPTYAFTFTNYSEIPGNTIRVIYTEGVPEGIEMPETITLMEMVGPGETYSGTLLIDLNNDLEGQEVCFDIILEQVLPNQAAIRCCYVTHCVVSLDCGPGNFAPDGGEVAILAYPNPANGAVMLASNYLGLAKVSLLSFTGQKAEILSVEFVGMPVPVALGNRPSGVYTVLVQFADGRQGVRRIVIK